MISFLKWRGFVVYFIFFLLSFFQLLTIIYLATNSYASAGTTFLGISLIFVYILQGLTWTLYVSKLASIYHSELGHDVYSANAHHGGSHNPHYVPVDHHIPAGHHVPVTHHNPLVHAPVNHHGGSNHHYGGFS